MQIRGPVSMIIDTCKPDQQQSPVPEVLEPISHRPENDKEVLAEERAWPDVELFRERAEYPASSPGPTD